MYKINWYKAGFVWATGLYLGFLGVHNPLWMCLVAGVLFAVVSAPFMYEREE